jgi:hypothetical protein
MYFYPVGVLEKADVATLAAREHDGIREARVKDGQGSLSDLDTFRIALPGDDGGTRLTAYALDLAYVHEGAPFNSAMTLYVHRLYATKARFSVADSVMSRGKARRMLQAFTADLAPKLAFSSTGACWSPLPIEALAARQAPEGALFAMSKEGKEHTWVYPDRVLAVDPASPDAQAAMYLGMAATGRMSEGCESPGTFMPEVPEGMREIRIEYHAPDDEAAPARRARANRMGVG